MTPLVADIIPRNARLSGERAAVVFGERCITFAEHAERVYRLSNALSSRGVQRQDRICVLAQNCPEYFEVYGACEISAFIAAPVNFRFAPAEIEAVITNVAAHVLFFEYEYAQTVAALRENLASVRHFVQLDRSDTVPDWALSYEEVLQQAAPTPPSHAIGADDTAYIIHTSGTTGRPKGAMLGQAAQHATAEVISAEGEITPLDRGLIVQPLFHVGAKFLQLAHHVCGATIYLHRRFEPDDVWNALETQAITTLQLAPTMIDRLLAEDGAGERDPGALRTIFYSTAPIRESLLRRGLQKFGPVFLQQYGATESGPVTALLKDQHVLDGSLQQQSWLRSAGCASVGVELKIVDSADQPVAAGVSGEILVRNAYATRGYWADADGTKAAFLDGWLRMGDIGYLDEDGFLFIVDRKKDMIVSGGENIYPREVELALLEHPGVDDVAVFGIPDDVWGESVRAAVVLRSGAKIAEAELIEYCRTRIASYKKPKHVDFHTELPRLSTGKIDKPKLRAPYWADRDRQVI